MLSNISKSDNNKYKEIKLNNGLQVLLINDENTHTSAASLAVNVGSFADPIDFLGLAHFLEHMLFMGSEKFPDENLYSKELSNYSGSSNAHTSAEETVYYFECLNCGFFKILEIFSRFFIDPLLKEDAINREVNAVNSEHEKNLGNDFRRIYEVFKYNSNPESDFYKFSTGNLKTLNKKGVYDELKKFHKQHYYGINMKLVVYSNSKLEIFENKIKELFKDVPNINTCKNSTFKPNSILPYNMNKSDISSENSMKQLLYVETILKQL